MGTQFNPQQRGKTVVTKALGALNQRARLRQQMDQVHSTKAERDPWLLGSGSDIWALNAIGEGGGN